MRLEKIVIVLAETERLAEFQQRKRRSFSKGNDEILAESGELSGVSRNDMLEFRQGIWQSFGKDMVEF